MGARGEVGGSMAKDKMKMASRVASAILVVLILSGAALAFRFVSSPITSQVTSDPPSGNLWVNGSFSPHFVINQSSVSVFWATNKINAPVTFRLNFTITGVSDLYTFDPTLAGNPPNLVLVTPNLYATSPGTWTLQPNEKIEIDCGGTFHKTGTFTLTLKAVGDA